MLRSPARRQSTATRCARRPSVHQRSRRCRDLPGAARIGRCARERQPRRSMPASFYVPGPRLRDCHPCRRLPCTRACPTTIAPEHGARSVAPPSVRGSCALYSTQTREALGVAEYFGPRGQILRTCAQPSMVKDGSGWGAHAGVSAAWLAREGFTGAPATTIESDGQRALWDRSRVALADSRAVLQAVSRLPVGAAGDRSDACAATDASVRRARHRGYRHRERFARRVALGADCPVPRTTEDAQLQFALSGRGGARVRKARRRRNKSTGACRWPRATVASRDDAKRRSSIFERFPAERWARVEIRLHDGRLLRSEPAQARGDPERPLSDAELREKFFSLAEPVLGPRKRSESNKPSARYPKALHFMCCSDALLEPVA